VNKRNKADDSAAAYRSLPAVVQGAAERFSSFAQRLINRYGSHMEAPRTTLRSVGSWRVGFWFLETLISRILLILDDPDVGRGRSWRCLSFRCLGQLFELTFLPTSLEGTTPRRWNIALGHEVSLGGEVVPTVALRCRRAR
jgi:hypothetical protein